MEDVDILTLQDALEEVDIAMERVRYALRRVLLRQRQPPEVVVSSSSTAAPEEDGPQTNPRQTRATVRSQAEILADVGDRDLRRRAAAFLGCARFHRHRRPCNNCKRATLAMLHEWDQQRRQQSPAPPCPCDCCTLHRAALDLHGHDGCQDV